MTTRLSLHRPTNVKCTLTFFFFFLHSFSGLARQHKASQNAGSCQTLLWLSTLLPDMSSHLHCQLEGPSPPPQPPSHTNHSAVLSINPSCPHPSLIPENTPRLLKTSVALFDSTCAFNVCKDGCYGYVCLGLSLAISAPINQVGK